MGKLSSADINYKLKKYHGELQKPNGTFYAKKH